MKRRLIALLTALLALGAPALAEVYAGTTAALCTVPVRASAAGVVEALNAEVGQRVGAGDCLAALRPERTFATQDGTVALICADIGDSVGGEVLELTPVERYTLRCTVDKAFQSAESTLVHSGETVYARCTSDGTHRAVGIVTQIDGAEFTVLTLGGELYVGETVYLYRDADFTAARRVGIGTALTADPEVYEGEGRLTLLRVSAGDTVERGQLLYATDGGEIAAAAGGILSSLSCRVGDAIAEDDIVAEIVPEDAVCVQISVDEGAAATLRPGDNAFITLAGQEDEVPGIVADISGIDDSGQYTVRVTPAQALSLPLGMSAAVRIP